eukprot:s2126_g1.t1
MSTRKLLLLPHAQDIHLLQGSPLHGVLMFFLRTEGAVRAATTATAWSTVAIELLLAFALWKKSWHLPAIVGAGFLHLAMSCICGELGHNDAISSLGGRSVPSEQVALKASCG